MRRTIGNQTPLNQFEIDPAFRAGLVQWEMRFIQDDPVWKSSSAPELRKHLEEAHFRTCRGRQAADFVERDSVRIEADAKLAITKVSYFDSLLGNDLVSIAETQLLGWNIKDSH